MQPARGRLVLPRVHGTAQAQEGPQQASVRAPVLSTAPVGSWWQGPGTVPGAERPSGRLEATAAPLLPPQPAAFLAPASRGSAGCAGIAPGLLPNVLPAGPESWEQHPSWETLLYPELLFNKDFRQLQRGTASLLPQRKDQTEAPRAPKAAPATGGWLAGPLHIPGTEQPPFGKKTPPRGTARCPGCGVERPTSALSKNCLLIPKRLCFPWVTKPSRVVL